jgi:hypothetical protein
MHCDPLIVLVIDTTIIALNAQIFLLSFIYIVKSLFVTCAYLDNNIKEDPSIEVQD